MIKISIEEFIIIYRYIDELVDELSEQVDICNKYNDFEEVIKADKEYKAIFKLWSALTDYYYKVIDHE